MIAGTLRSGKCFRHSSFRFPNRDIRRPTEQALKGSSRSARIEPMSSDSAAPTGDAAKSPSLPHSSAVVTAPPLKSHGTVELHSTALRTGTAARRLLAKDAREDAIAGLREAYGFWRRLRRHGWSTVRYLMQTEVHTYAFSVAANFILSFFPFIVLQLTLLRRVIRSTEMYNLMLLGLHDYLPSNQDFVIRNLQFLASVKGRGQVLSLVMLLITSTGIFLPLVVALNSVWGFKKNRSYLMNALASFGLAVLCGVVALLSVAAVAKGLHLLGLVMGSQNLVFNSVTNIAIYFLIYWLLPHGKVPIRAVLPAAVITGLVTEAAKYLYALLLPWLNFPQVYGPFSISVTLMFWAYFNGMLLLGGAFLSAAEYADRVQARRETAAANR